MRHPSLGPCNFLAELGNGMMISQWSARLTKVARRTAKESAEIVHHAFSARPLQLRQVLLDQARSSNNIAVCLLGLEKEMNLVRYYGLSKYMQRSLNGDQNVKMSSSSEARTTPSKPSQNSKAQVAFMITSAMKNDLAEAGYEADRIRKMTPQQANLIISHKVVPSEQASRLPILETEFQAAITAASEMSEAEQSEAPEEDTTTSMKANEGSLLSDELHAVNSAKIAIPATLAPFAPNTEDASQGTKVWFQVVRVCDGESIGMFSSEEEANERVEIQKDLCANRQYTTKDEHREDVEVLVKCVVR